MDYNFDEVIDRRGTCCEKVDGMVNVWGKSDLIPMWVADMDFATPPFILEAIRKRCEHSAALCLQRHLSAKALCRHRLRLGLRQRQPDRFSASFCRLQSAFVAENGQTAGRVFSYGQCRLPLFHGRLSYRHRQNHAAERAGNRFGGSRRLV